VASPKFGLWWVLWIQVCLWLILTPKCSNYSLMNLLFGLCRSVWVSDYLWFFHCHPEAPTCPSTFKVLQVRERAPTPYISTIFTLNSHLNLSRSLGAPHERCKQNKSNWRDLMKQSRCNGNHQVRGQKCLMTIHTSHHDIRIVLWYPSTLWC